MLAAVLLIGQSGCFGGQSNLTKEARKHFWELNDFTLIIV